MSKSRTITLEHELEQAQRARPCPMLFRVISARHPLTPASAHMLHQIDEVRIGRGEANTRRHRDGNRSVLALTLSDHAVSSEHARIEPRNEGWWLRDCGSKNGTRLDGKTIEQTLLHDGARIEIGDVFFVFRSSLEIDLKTPLDLTCSASVGNMESLVPALRNQMRNVMRIASTDRAVLITGATGTGKELVARAIHDASQRTGAFVPVNCGALADSVLEAELFGHRKGAFSGADENRAGLIPSSTEGTLFLDEIGDLSRKGQAALLRVLQEREVRPVGATRAAAVDLRVIAATHRDLEEMIEGGHFRDDLFARLNGFQVSLPPLRERHEDLGVLVQAIMHRHARHKQPFRLSPQLVRSMLSYEWPRNVRELDAALIAAMDLADPDDEGVLLERSQFRALRAAEPSTPTQSEATPLSEADRALREKLVALLEKHDGNVSQAAKEVGKKRQQLQKWFRRLEIDVSRYRP